MVIPWAPWRTSDGAVLPVHHHLHQLAGRHQITVLAAGSGSPDEERVVGPDRSLPDGVVVRWYGTARPGWLDLADRRVRGSLRREPAHALYVERAGLMRAFDELAPQVDLVHLAGWGTAQLAARTATPAVHFAIDPWAGNLANRQLTGARRLAEAGQRRLAARHERRWYPRSRAVALVAEPDAQLLGGQIPGARFVVVPNGVVAGEPPAPLPEEPVLGFHGAFEAQANVDAARVLVERVWPRVRASVPEARVLLVGRSPGPEVQALVQPGVELVADAPSVRAELDRMAVHVDWMTSGMGLKNKVLEAMAAGRPVVANSKGANGIGAGPGLVVAASEDEAAQQTVALLSDRSLLAQQGAAARSRVAEHFSWRARAEALARAWADALA